MNKEYETLLKKIGNPRNNTYMDFVKDYYMKKIADPNWGGWASVCEISNYCSEEKKKITGEGFGDPPRRFEQFRKDITPGYWDEKQVGKYKYVKFKIPTEEDILVSKDHGFTSDIQDNRLKESNYTCEITGLPFSEGKVACDHWFPKEKGGESTQNNCVILNKILNEKKNNHLPEEWFCKHLLKNFLNICKRVNNIDDIKSKLIKFIQEFE
tara:strand:- start:232 stop:864 length:633 start_codon:yes stop_codon:yes gene_type:complete